MVSFGTYWHGTIAVLWLPIAEIVSAERFRVACIVRTIELVDFTPVVVGDLAIIC